MNKNGGVDLVALAIVVVVVAVCGVASYAAADNHLHSQDDDGNNNDGLSDEDTSPEEKVGTSANVLYNYNIVKTIDDFTYTNHYGLTGTEIPNSGCKFVVVDIVVKNDSLADGYLPDINDFMIQCEDGNLYRCDVSTMNYSSAIGNVIRGMVLGIGSSVTYAAVYEIPIETSASGLSWGGMDIRYTAGEDPSLEFTTLGVVSTSPETDKPQANILYDYNIVKTIDDFTYTNHYDPTVTHTETPTDGYKFVVVDIVVKNNSRANGYRVSPSDFDIQCADGKQYWFGAMSQAPTLYYSLEQEYMFVKVLGIGDSATGTVVVSIPVGTSMNGFSWNEDHYRPYTGERDSSLEFKNTTHGVTSADYMTTKYLVRNIRY